MTGEQILEVLQELATVTRRLAVLARAAGVSQAAIDRVTRDPREQPEVG